MAWLLTLMPIAACTNDDGDADAPPTASVDLHASGDRIRARVGVTDDGSSQLIGWHDIELDKPCEFQLAEDRELRCLPAAARTEYFADPACKVPLVPMNNCPRALPAYVATTGIDTGSDGCRLPETTVMHELVGMYTASVYYHSFGDNDPCTSKTDPPSLMTTRRVEPTRFAKRTIVIAAP